MLSVLERTGVRFGSAKALDILAEHGAEVDRASGVVRFAPDLVTAALAKAPRTFWLGSRDGTLDLDLASGDTYNTTNGCGTEVVDWRTGVRRPPTKDDLAAITRMVDYLGSIQFWWPNVAAADSGDTHTLHELDAAWNNTAKHLQGMVQGEREARYAVEMATVIAGGAEQLRRRPPMSNLIGTVQPLVNDKDGIEAALVFAEAGIPVCFVTMPTYGTTAPATKAGAYVMGFAELVSATVCVQLAHPGAPVILFPLPVHADPRTAALTTAPLNHRGLFLPAELVHHFGLPAMTGYAGTDDDLPGQLAGRGGDGAHGDARRPRRLRAHDDHRAHQSVPAVHARAHDARRRPLPARGERVPRPRARRGRAGARRHRRGGARRALPGRSRTRAGT